MSFTFEESVQYSTASNTVVFSGTPSAGQLIVITAVSYDDDADDEPLLPSGFSEAVSFNVAGTFRWGKVFYKVAGGSETNSYAVTTTSGAPLVYTSGRLYTVTGTPAVGNTDWDYDTSSVSSRTSNVTASSGSLLIAVGSTSISDSTATKSWNSGWVNVQSISATGRGSSADKISSGGSEDAIWTLSTGTDNRLATMLVEFTESGGTTYPQNRGRLIGTGTIGQGNGFGYKRF